MAQGRIDDEEHVLRHIPGGTTWQAPGPRITSKNFELRPALGETGVSVSRSLLTRPPELLRRLGNPAAGSRIAAASVKAVRELGLDVVPDPKDYDPGHALICSASASLADHRTRKALATLFSFLPVDPTV